MAKHNLAYDLSRYENAVTQAEKEKSTEKNKRAAINHVRQKASTQGSAPMVFVLACTAGLLLGMVIYGKVDQAAIHTEIAKQTRYVDILRSENVRMKSELEGKSSIKTVEEYAENVLGMKKLDKSQIEYISIENGNVIDIPETNNNIFVKIKNAFNDFLEYIRG